MARVAILLFVVVVLYLWGRRPVSSRVRKSHAMKLFGGHAERVAHMAVALFLW